MIEAGRRFSHATYARSSWNLRRFLWFPWLGLRGIQRIDLLSEVMVLSGAGVGGGSLVYANTLIEPQEGYFADPQWRDITDWRKELAEELASRQQSSGSWVNENPRWFESDPNLVTSYALLALSYCRPTDTEPEKNP